MLDGSGANPKVKRRRTDISFEQWSRSRANASFEFLGEGRQIEPVLFESDRDHALVLTVTDRTGSRARKICEFHVTSPEGVSP